MKKPNALLAAMQAKEAPPEPAVQPEPEATPRPPAKGRAGQKHIGAYFEKGDPILEQLAILRTRLEMTNSQLIEHALKELWARHEAGRKFGD